VDQDRCAWANSAPEYVVYHDEEWGTPLRGDDALFERVCLEAFQSGLSWITILRKRPAFRAAFAGFAIDAVDDLDDEVEEGRLVHELGPVISAIGKQMLDPWPALANGVEDHLSAGAVGEIGRGEIDHQQSSVGIDDDVALSSDQLLGGVVAALSPRCRGFHCLAVDHPGARAGFAARSFPVHHHGDVVDGAEQHQSHETAEPPIYGLPGGKVLRQHAPATTRARHVADRVQNLAHRNARLAPAPARLRQPRRDTVPFLISQIGRIAFGLPLDRGHPASRLSCPHP